MARQRYRVAVIGATGVVGRKIVDILVSRGFPVEGFIPVATERSTGCAFEAFGHSWPVQDASRFEFSADIDFGFFTAGAAVSQALVPSALARGVRVIDNTTAFRMREDVPLVVPEINGHVVGTDTRLVSCPNCTTINLVMALAPLLSFAEITKVVVTSFQSVSGAGREALDELDAQVEAERSGSAVAPRVFPEVIAYNCVPVIGAFQPSGYTGEEQKIIEETQKILSRPSLTVVPTAVRVPVRVGHALSVYVEMDRDVESADLIGAWRDAEGVAYSDEVPTPLRVAGQDTVRVGRLRRGTDRSDDACFWVVGDNLRKGAATNSVQIAELMVAG